VYQPALQPLNASVLCHICVCVCCVWCVFGANKYLHCNLVAIPALVRVLIHRTTDVVHALVLLGKLHSIVCLLHSCLFMCCFEFFPACCFFIYVFKIISFCHAIYILYLFCSFIHCPVVIVREAVRDRGRSIKKRK